jgi:CubicO group peptidase (beta-lactamase class C family)
MGTATPSLSRVAREAEELGRPLIDDGWIAGAAIALVDGDTVMHTALGEATADGHPPSPDTIFEIGSVSKVFTATLLAEMVARGEVALSDRLNDVLADAGDPTRDVQLLHLATHTSGLPFLPEGFSPDPSDPYATYGETDLKRALAQTVRRSAGVAFEYSNLGMAVLAIALTERAGRPFDRLLQERIARPLSLEDTYVGAAMRQTAPVAEGHDADGNRVPAWTFAAFAGAGGIRSSPRDLAKLVQAHMNPPATSLGMAIRETIKVRYALNNREGSMGLAWNIAPDGTRWHNGETGGFHAWVGFDPERKQGVVVLANSAAPIVDQFGAVLLRRLRGDRAELDVPSTVQLSDAQLTAYAGTYAFAPGLELVIRVDAGRLLARMTGQAEHRLYAASDAMLYWRVVDAKVEMLRSTDASEAVTEVRLHQGGVISTAKRVSAE